MTISFSLQLFKFINVAPIRSEKFTKFTYEVGCLI